MEIVTSVDGTRIAYDKRGDGPPLVLVGGAFSYRRYPGTVELMELLAPHFAVYNYDRRGRGDSGDTAPFSVDREVEDLAAVIAAAGGAAHVWGMSSGGALALEAASRGLAITKVAAYEPPFMVGEGGHRPPADREEYLDSLVSSGRRGKAVSYFLTEVMGAPAFFAGVLRLTPAWARLKAVAHTLPYDLRIMGDFSLPADRLASITVPTLVVHGEKSPDVLRRAAAAAADAVPEASRHSLAGQRHAVSWKVLAPVLTTFFRD